MPKDDSQPSFASSKDKPTLKRNQACLRCRSRKLRCDAVRPTCGTCERSWKHACQHLKPGQTPPSHPDCHFEDPAITGPSSSGGGAAVSGQTKAKVGELETRISELEGMLKQAVGIEGLGMLAGKNASGGANQQHQQQPQQTFDGPSLWAGGGQQSWNLPSPQQQQPALPSIPPPNASAHASRHGGLPPFPSFFSLPPAPMSFNPSASLSSSASTYEQQHHQQLPQLGRLYNQSSFTTHFPSSSSSPQPKSPVPPPPPSWPFLSANSTSKVSNISPFDNFPPSNLHSAPSPLRPSLFDSPQPTSPPIPWPVRQSSGPTIEEVVETEDPKEKAWGAGRQDPPLMRSNPTGRAPTQAAIEMWLPPVRIEELVAQQEEEEGGIKEIGAEGEGEATVAEEAIAMDLGGLGVAEEYYMQLLWPGWPSHLPSPGKLEHIVNSFFQVVSFSTELFNQARFRQRLSLPPTHKHFPHPALLHAICAITSRYIGTVELTPPGIFHPLRFPSKRNELEKIKMPTWDGYGTKPATATPSVDEDFGEVHYKWSSLYVQQGKDNPAEWLPLVQALLLLSQYCHQHAKWVQGWNNMALMGRLAIPLALLARPYDPESAVGTSLLEPPQDEIDAQERNNLAWLLFCQDTYSSTSSGWVGALDDRDLFLGLPTSHSSFPFGSVPPSPSQFANDEEIRLFSTHPPEHSNSWALSIKGTLLLRKVSDFIRRVTMSGIVDPRGTDEFVRLDKLITIFRSSFPPEFSNPLNCVKDEGKALDRNLVLALTLPYISLITLHDRFTDPHDPNDRSAPRMLASARALLGQVYLIRSTNFDPSLMHPFMCHSWFLGAKSLLKQLQAALERQDKIAEQSILSDIGVFSRAMDSLAERLPIGSRQKTSLDHLIADVLADETHRTVFPANVHSCPNLTTHYFPSATLSDSPSAVDSPSDTTSGSISSTAKTPPALAGGAAGPRIVNYGSKPGEPGNWIYSQNVVEEMETLRVPWESRR